jgi:hypothetical protein
VCLLRPPPAEGRFPRKLEDVPLVDLLAVLISGTAVTSTGTSAWTLSGTSTSAADKSIVLHTICFALTVCAVCFNHSKEAIKEATDPKLLQPVKEVLSVDLPSAVDTTEASDNNTYAVTTIHRWHNLSQKSVV